MGIRPLVWDGDCNLIPQMYVETIHHGLQEVKISQTNDVSTVVATGQSVAEQKKNVS